MRPLPNRFQSLQLEQHEEEVARQISPYTFAFIQNKVAAYANAVLEYQYDSTRPLEPQIIEHEKLKAQVIVLEELLQELQVPESQPSQSQSHSE